MQSVCERLVSSRKKPTQSTGGSSLAGSTGSAAQHTDNTLALDTSEA